MIGFFIFDELPTVDVVSVLCHAKSNSEIKGYFYVRQTDCHDVSSVQVGDEFFGVLDDATGYGACIYVVGLSSETDALYATKNIQVDGHATIHGNVSVHSNVTINGDTAMNQKLQVIGNIKTSAYIGGNVTANITLTQAQAAAIVAAAAATGPTTIPTVTMQFVLPA